MVLTQPRHGFPDQVEAELNAIRRAIPRGDQAALERAHAERIRIRTLMRAKEAADDETVRFLRDIAVLVIAGLKCAASFAAMIAACILLGAASVLGGH